MHDRPGGENNMTSPSSSPSPETGPPSPLRQLLTQLMQGFRGASVLLDQQGQALHTNAAAQHATDASRAPAGDDPVARPQEWPHRIAFSAGGDEIYYLAVASSTSKNTETTTLPPRLAKIAQLVIAGFSDKQISSRTGLSFSTVRTYVRQIYRRTNVHSRVGLVRISSGRSAI